METLKSFDVVIPVYNGIATLERAVRSVVPSLDYVNKIILIDDGSDDQTADLIESLRREFDIILVITNERNEGVASARNRGLDQCAAEYVAFLDCDDCWSPKYLMIMSHYINQLGNPGVVAGGYLSPVPFDHQWNVDSFIQPKITRLTSISLLIRNQLSTPCVVLSRDVYSEYRFDKRLKTAEDYLLWLQISVNHEIYKIDMTLAIGYKRVFGVSGLSKAIYQGGKNEIRAYPNPSTIFL
mgnify:CR=1 FL=1